MRVLGRRRDCFAGFATPIVVQAGLSNTSTAAIAWKHVSIIITMP